MRCLVLEKFNRRGEPQLPGSIIDVPTDVLPKLAGYVRPLVTEIGCYCSSKDFRQGINGLICAKCQVPENSILRHYMNGLHAHTV